MKIVLQNALYSQKGETTDRLRKLMRTRISDYNSFVTFKKETTVTYRLWERTFQKFPDQHSMEWTRQLIKCQMFVTMKHQGPLRDRLLQALSKSWSFVESGPGDAGPDWSRSQDITPCVLKGLRTRQLKKWV